MPEVQVGDIVMNYQEAGSGDPVIFLHGLSDDSNLWGLLIPQLAGYFRCIAVDLRGHGRSSKPDMPYTIRMFSDDLLGFMEKKAIPRSNMVGLSMGAAIIQQIAVDHPEKVESIVLLSAFDHADPACRANLIKLRDSINEGGLSRFFDTAVGMVVTPSFLAANIKAIEEMKIQAVRINSASAIINAINACLGFNLADRVGQIAVPTLLISGKNDVLTPPYLAGGINKSIKGSKLMTMDGVGHNLLIPEKIEPLAGAILKFLQA